MFWSIKTSHEVLRRLKSRGFPATSLSTYGFSTLYNTLPHNLIKTLIVLIERTFKEKLKQKVRLPVTIKRRFSLLQTIEGINFVLSECM